jgi:hypothetical protein
MGLANRSATCSRVPGRCGPRARDWNGRKTR